MLHQKFAFIFIFSLIFTGCYGIEPSVTVAKTKDPPTPNLTTTPTTHPYVADSPTPTRVSLTIEPESTPTLESLPNTHYSLTAVLNYGEHYLAVDEHIHYVNRSPDTLTDLLLMVEPLNYPGVFQLNGIVWDDDQHVENYSFEGAQLSVSLRQPLAPGESLDISLTYDLSLPSPNRSSELRPVPFGYSNRQTNLVDWYPFVPPYIPDKGWLAHKPGYFGEHLVYDVADFEVNIRVTDNRSDLTIAASAPAEVDGALHRYHLESARNFVWSISHEYQIITTTVDSVTIHSYVFPFHSQAGEAVLKTTAEALSLYNELYEPYPRDMLTVVEADFLDGMEYDGLYFLSNGFYNIYQGSPGEYLIAIAAHETAHQWFYALVGNDQAVEPWLDEALCTYNEHIFYEHKYPEALDWWWKYRVSYYEPQGGIDGSIYNPAGYRAYRDAIYLNGALFLEDLRNLMGDEIFFQFLSDYVRLMSYQIATTDNFFAILSKHTSTDLTTLLDRYFTDS